MNVTKNLIQSQCSLIVPLVITVIFLGQCTQATDYCSLCQNHIACKYNAVNALSFGSSCSADRVIVKMTNEQKEYILKLHNRMRNKLALGEIQGYSPATKMPVFVSIQFFYWEFCCLLRHLWHLRHDYVRFFFGFSNGATNWNI